MSDHREAQGQLAEQGLRVLQAQQDLAVQTALLVLGAQTAWLALWALPAPQASEDFRVSQARRVRTARLVRRGVPEQLARQGLRVL